MSERALTKWAVFVIVRNEKGEILLQQRARDAKYLNGYWDFPSGHGEYGEDLRMTAIRELKEEVGLDGRAKDLRLVHIDQFFVEDDYINFVFTLDKWSGTPKVCEPDKCDAVGWFAEDALPEKCVNAVQAVKAAGFGGGLTYSITDKLTYYGPMNLPKPKVQG